jgi:ADP-ribose pyrophosphatase
LAADLTPAEQDLDDDEMLKVQTVKLEAALQMILTGEISDGKTISGLFLASNWLKEKHADMNY